MDDSVQTGPDKKVYIVRDGKGIDAATGKPVDPLPDNLEDVVIANVMRKQIGLAIAALRLTSPDKEVRLAAVKELQGNAEEDSLPALAKALAKESDAQVKTLLTLTQASIQLRSKDKATRIKAINELAKSNNPNTKTLLLGLLEKKGDQYVEADPEIRSAAQGSLNAVQSRLSTGERYAQIFSGISLGSILLLAALGLAITYGLMGVINMAHGEPDHGWRLQHLLCAKPVQGACARRLRLVPAGGGAGVVHGGGSGGHGAGTGGDPLAVRPAAGDAAGDAGASSLMLIQSLPHHLRRAKRGGGKPGVDERRGGDHDRHRAAV